MASPNSRHSPVQWPMNFSWSVSSVRVESCPTSVTLEHSSCWSIYYRSSAQRVRGPECSPLKSLPEVSDEVIKRAPLPISPLSSSFQAPLCTAAAYPQGPVVLITAKVRSTAGECFQSPAMRGELPSSFLAQRYSCCPVLRCSAFKAKPGLFFLACQEKNVVALDEPEYGVFHPLRLACNQYGDQADSFRLGRHECAFIRVRVCHHNLMLRSSLSDT